VIRVGVSACLLGERVRWNGAHKLEPTLGELEVEWVLVCPEVELGLGVPRPQMEVVAGRMRVVGNGVDLTEEMRAFAARRVAELADLDGYILKVRSPSCDPGFGLFAAALQARFPDLPIAHEEELRDAAARARFRERVAAHHSRRAGIQTP
jgi:uncharacterized protein YbbK (DUF523 family)